MTTAGGDFARFDDARSAKLRLRDGLRVEPLGEDLLVLDTDGDVAHTVTGAAVDVVRRLADGEPVNLKHAQAVTIDELIDAGIVTDDRVTDDSGVSRRKVMIAGGVAWTAATVTTFALANPAAAATGCPGGIVPTGPTSYTVNGKHQFTTGTGASTLLTRCWGAGGGGGGAGWSRGGGGGGGGAYASSVVDVTDCTTYTLVVGWGGAGGPNGTGFKPGSPGGQGVFSHFGAPALVLAAGGKGGSNGDFSSSASGGSGGSASPPDSFGTTVYSGGSGGKAEYGGGGGGGSAGSAGPGGNGTDFGPLGIADVAGGAAGAGSPGGATGGVGSYHAVGGAGGGPGGGGGGGSGWENHTGGAGADGAVWVGI